MITIVKYNAGNVTSVQNALNRLGVESQISDNPYDLSSADKVIFPGVGSAGSAMHYLKNQKLDELIPKLKQPVLGICLGMQLMCDYTEENNTEGLQIFPCQVKKITGQVKVPHMGWNSLHNMKGKLFQNIRAEADVYFVHSYAADLCPYTISSTEYGSSFSSALQKNNFYGVQFHPEKSGKVGEVILQNFLSL